MKDQITNKINSFIDYIISKPVSEITKEDYTILASERDYIQRQEQQTANSKRMAELMASTFYNCSST